LSDRILLVSHQFPPGSSPESYLSAKRMGALPGFSVDVVCGESLPGWFEDNDHSLDDYVATRFGEVIRVRRRPVWGIARVGRKAPLLCPPDEFRLLNGPERRAATRSLRAHRYAAVVTWSQMHSVHLVGLSLKRRFGMPWLAHFSDPWVGNPFLSLGRIERRLNERLERRVLRAADRLLFTSPEAVDLTMTPYPDRWREKARVLPHAYDTALFPPEVDRPPRERLVFRYMGAFYGRRSPRPLVRALSHLASAEPELVRRLSVQIVGRVESGLLRPSETAVLPPGTLDVLPPVDYVRSLELMADADGLLVVDAPATTSPFLPSKLVDYVGAGRPIGALTPPGPAATLTRRLGGPVADPEDVHACAEALQSLAALAEGASTSAPFGPPEVRREYAVATVGAQMADVVRELVSPTPGASSARESAS
jgi:glycosyltransferase involved in cell wall biosynthesis